MANGKTINARPAASSSQSLRGRTGETRRRKCLQSGWFSPRLEAPDHRYPTAVLLKPCGTYSVLQFWQQERRADIETPNRFDCHNKRVACSSSRATMRLRIRCATEGATEGVLPIAATAVELGLALFVWLSRNASEPFKSFQVALAASSPIASSSVEIVRPSSRCVPFASSSFMKRRDAIGANIRPVPVR